MSGSYDRRASHTFNDSFMSTLQLNLYFINFIRPHIRELAWSTSGLFSLYLYSMTNLIMFHFYIISSFSNRMQVDTIFLDFSKVFDMVSHLHLLAKLSSHRIHGPLLGWFIVLPLWPETDVKVCFLYLKTILCYIWCPQGLTSRSCTFQYLY